MRAAARPARALMAAAALLLVVSTTYAVLAQTPDTSADGWSGPREGMVVSGDCTRTLRLLPSLTARPPGFVRLGDETFVRRSGTPTVPPGVSDTRYRYRGWRLLRSGKQMYLVNIERPEMVASYERAECR